ncbi:hypothetical protein PBRA_009701, partial [Plasmodiophora brassicae]
MKPPHMRRRPSGTPPETGGYTAVAAGASACRTHQRQPTCGARALAAGRLADRAGVGASASGGRLRRRRVLHGRVARGR